MTRYAEGTSVAADRTRAELEKLLRSRGADAFMYASDEQLGEQLVAFRMSGRHVRIGVPMPDRGDPLFTQTPTGKRRSDVQAEEAYDAEVRRRWRALLLVVKAKLTAVADGISTLEREFLADIVTQDGRTVAEVVAPALAVGTGPLALTGGGRV